MSLSKAIEEALIGEINPCKISVDLDPVCFQQDAHHLIPHSGYNPLHVKATISTLGWIPD